MCTFITLVVLRFVGNWRFHDSLLGCVKCIYSVQIALLAMTNSERGKKDSNKKH